MYGGSCPRVLYSIWLEEVIAFTKVSLILAIGRRAESNCAPVKTSSLSRHGQNIVSLLPARVELRSRRETYPSKLLKHSALCRHALDPSILSIGMFKPPFRSDLWVVQMGQPLFWPSQRRKAQIAMQSTGFMPWLLHCVRSALGMAMHPAVQYHLAHLLVGLVNSSNRVQCRAW